MIISEKTKKIILIVALTMIVLSLVWTFTMGANSERSKICAFLRNYGYNIKEDELLFAYDSKNTTIYDAADQKDLTEAIVASQAKGFSSNIEAHGDVTLILAKSGTTTIYIYMLNGKQELCFTETQDGKIKPLGE